MNPQPHDSRHHHHEKPPVPNAHDRMAESRPLCFTRAAPAAGHSEAPEGYVSVPLRSRAFLPLVWAARREAGLLPAAGRPACGCRCAVRGTRALEPGGAPARAARRIVRRPTGSPRDAPGRTGTARRGSSTRTPGCGSAWCCATGRLIDLSGGQARWRAGDEVPAADRPARGRRPRTGSSSAPAPAVPAASADGAARKRRPPRRAAPARCRVSENGSGGGGRWVSWAGAAPPRPGPPSTTATLPRPPGSGRYPGWDRARNRPSTRPP